MKRWTNGLPGATKRLGAKMALQGLSPSESRMRADTHDGPEQIAPLQRPDTLMQLSRSLILEVHLVPHGRAIGVCRLHLRVPLNGQQTESLLPSRRGQPLDGLHPGVANAPGSFPSTDPQVVSPIFEPDLSCLPRKTVSLMRMSASKRPNRELPRKRAPFETVRLPAT
jgi:hypothetical protein